MSVRWRSEWLRLWPWPAAISSGLLAAGALPPFDQTWLCWIALVPLIFAIWFSGTPGRRRWIRDTLLGYVAGLFFFWVSFFWITTVTGAGWFALAFYLAVYFAVWGCACGLVCARPEPGAAGKTKWSTMLARARPSRREARARWLHSGHNLWLGLTLAAIWVGLEWIRGWLFSGFGWNGAGVGLHATWPLIQIAEFTGVAGPSFLVVFANVILATTARRLWEESRTRAMRPHYDLTFTLIGLIGVFTFGIMSIQNRPAARLLKVGLVQSAVARDDKFDLRNKQIIFEKFEHLSEIALHTSPPCDLLVWPESAMPAPVLVDRETFDFVQHLALTDKVDVLLGAIDEDGERAYNAALLFAPPQAVQSYRKIHLVPFGEYVPLRHSFPLFAEIAGNQVPSDFDAGQDYTVFHLSRSRGNVAPLICFEDTLGELTRRFVLAGADLLVNVTNDGWFLRSAGSRQHLANAVFRCVETRRPMVRAANTGVTCFINQYGRVTQMLRDDRGSIFDEGTLVGTVDLPRDPPTTFYMRHGELFAETCGVFGAMVLLTRLLIHRRFASKREAVATSHF